MRPFIATITVIAVFCAVAFATFPGEGQRTICPVSGEQFVISDSTPFVEFLGPKGQTQKIFVCCDGCRKKLLSNMTNYFRNPRQDPVWDYTPNLTNSSLMCPVCKEVMSINSHTPRVQFIGGQSLYLNCFNCVNKFFTSPEKWILNP